MSIQKLRYIFKENEIRLDNPSEQVLFTQHRYSYFLCLWYIIKNPLALFWSLLFEWVQIVVGKFALFYWWSTISAGASRLVHFFIAAPLITGSWRKRCRIFNCEISFSLHSIKALDKPKISAYITQVIWNLKMKRVTLNLFKICLFILFLLQITLLIFQVQHLLLQAS